MTNAFQKISRQFIASLIALTLVFSAIFIMAPSASANSYKCYRVNYSNGKLGWFAHSSRDSAMKELMSQNTAIGLDVNWYAYPCAEMSKVFHALSKIGIQ